ncbi:trafficking protein particle complex subunit 11-like isoform X2 [Branchiostoma floridae]|uniref:Trafficking protein particle complex subunit 11-like isoform X2 n=1 Tax=Branchiostoma floridae TaxID=7739 RepID=A0A9J7N5V7_BRAFL|nr:trafficking protein particle complex subunit 11-like isoform X2 [Branchiostoma floridae]
MEKAGDTAESESVVQPEVPPQTMATSWELPTELCCRPLALVALTGMDVTYNAVHRAIWDAFSANRRADRVPLAFRVLPGDHEYPKCKTKRQSYEWYIPKGILKTGWMNKQLNMVPAVVVVFFDLDWDEPLWREKQMECATRVEVVRASLQGRSTRVAVVLIQKNAPLPPGEDMVAAERAAALCSACELSAKSLFVLPHTDHLLGYIIRLENAFYELAQNYYHMEARRVKSHKEFLNKTTHQLLFVRHQFKIAFYNEMKQDTHTALKHYKQAYQHLNEVRTHDTNMLEIKTVSGFINYKICRLSFQHNAPLDAIAQFRKHVDLFKNKVGCAELAFEHSSWISKQFQVFGDLFDEAIKLGLTAIQTQHPGFYYQQAANHAITRKELCRKLCDPTAKYPSTDPLELAAKLDFYGQRPWRQGHQSIDPPDAQKEREGILSLQLLELTVDHSWIIIPLLSSAVAQFKKYKSARMKRYLMVQMGEEYYHAKDYGKALTLLTRVLWDYRSERWWALLTAILTCALKCAYLVANVQEYISISLELIGQYTLTSAEEKTRIQMNLIRVMSGDPPEPEPECVPEAVEEAKQLWTSDAIQTVTQPFTIELQNLVPFVECKAGFSLASNPPDKHMVLDVYLSVRCPFPIRFSKLSVLLSNPAYNKHCTLADSRGIANSDAGDAETGDLYLVPGQVKHHQFLLIPTVEDVGRKVEITSVALELGTPGTRSAILHWQGGGGDAATNSSAPRVMSGRRREDQPAEIDWDGLSLYGSISVVPRPPRVQVQLKHKPPALANEFYAVELTVESQEDDEITEVSLHVGLKDGQDTSLESTTHICFDAPTQEDAETFIDKPQPQAPGLSVGSLKTGEKVTRTMYMRCLQVGQRMLSVRVVYNIQVSIGKQASPICCTCVKEEIVPIETVMPVDASIRLKSLLMDALEQIHYDEPFLLLTDISCVSPWSIRISSTELQLTEALRPATGQLESHIHKLQLNKNDRASDCYCLTAPLNKIHQGSVLMGEYSIRWRRADADDSIPYVMTVLSLPEVPIMNLPVMVEMELPAHGRVREPLGITYTLHNRTSTVQEMEVMMEPSEAFMFSGHKQVHFRLLPYGKHILTYNLYPLLSGHMVLPRLHVNMLRYPGTTDQIISKMMPTHVFIMPTGKEAMEEVFAGS